MLPSNGGRGLGTREERGGRDREPSSVFRSEGFSFLTEAKRVKYETEIIVPFVQLLL